MAIAAKHGSFSGFDRRVLGHHAKPGDTSIAEYSRDLLATPLRKLEAVRKEIVSGSFRPDETRSGRFCKPFADETTLPGSAEPSSPSIAEKTVDREDVLTESESDGFGKVEEESERIDRCKECRTRLNKSSIRRCSECKEYECSACFLGVNRKGQFVCADCLAAEEIEQVSATDDSVSEDSSGDSDEQAAEVVKAAESVAAIELGRDVVTEPDSIVVQHRRHKTLHSGVGTELSDMKLKCGRTFLTAVHVILSHQPSFSWPECKQCFPPRDKEPRLEPVTEEAQDPSKLDAHIPVSGMLDF